MPVKFTHRGNLKQVSTFMQKCLELFKSGKLDKYGRDGVSRLASVTPADTGRTASSWEYRIDRDRKGISIVWYNTNLNGEYSIALLLQYGHAIWNSSFMTSKEDGALGGTYVRGVDYINPVMKPLFDSIVEELEREVR